jgi:DNA segregation ATPase FtsK/SpoIIIE, S-DNA-T family
MNVRLFTPRESASGPAAEPELGALARRWREAIALISIAFSVYLGLALGSFSAAAEGVPGSDTNWMGPVGGSLASVLAHGFGILAWGIPVELVLLAAPLIKRRDPELSGLRAAGDTVVVIILAALVHVAFPTATVFGGVAASGHVGLLFGELFSALFSGLGSFLVGGTAIGLILIGRSSFSFIEWCARMVRLGSWLQRRVNYWLHRAADAGLQLWQRRLRGQPAELDVEFPRKHRPSVGTDGFWVPGEHTGPPAPVQAAALKAAWQELQNPPKEMPEVTADAPEAPASEPKARRKRKAVEVSAAPDIEPEEALEAEPAVAAVPRRSVAEITAEARARGGASLKIVETRQNIEVERVPGATQKADRAGFVLPDTALLEPAAQTVVTVDKDRVHEVAARLEKTLLDYGVSVKVEEVHPGPTVTTYEVSPEAGTKVSKVASLADDLALGLSRKVRIIAPIPGKARIGFEIPNDERVPVNLRELIEDARFKKLAERVALPVVLGRDIVGAPFYADLAAMPHVIVAGATGAGKSVGLNVMLSSLLFKRTPEDLRMLMIDPKVVELAPFDGIPHMLLPVVTDMKQAAKALKWAVDEMERRYQGFAVAGTKNISTYNRWVERVIAGELPAPRPEEVMALTTGGVPVSVPTAKDGSDGVQLPGKMPHIVIVVDEFADLIMQQGKEVESAVARLAQKARAAGMHVVLATQRPSVDVITGMIKANFPTRIAFRVAQKVDSRTILDEMGAELLLGRGDMLVKLNGGNETCRVQCPFVSEEEVTALTDYLRQQGAPVYNDEILKGGDDEEGAEAAPEELDPRFDEAVRIVAETQRCSTSWLQRKMTIGYNRAAKIVESMELRGIVGPPNGAKDREIFVHPH